MGGREEGRGERGLGGGGRGKAQSRDSRTSVNPATQENQSFMHSAIQTFECTSVLQLWNVRQSQNSETSFCPAICECPCVLCCYWIVHQSGLASSACF